MPQDYAKLRQQYGRIFSATLRGVEYVFRSITVDEYNYIILRESYDTEVDSEALVVEMALLEPSYDYAEQQPAGVITSLASEILSSSGYASLDVMQQYLEEHRQNIANNLVEMMCATIISAIPTYTIEDLKDYTLDHMLYLVAMSEQIIKVQQESMQGEVAFTIEAQEVEEQQATAKRQPDQQSGPINPGEIRPDDPIADKLFQDGG